jgi:hypothetical protein
MKIIAHRGNLNGRNPEQENCPSYIQAAVDAGYDVEVDVWYVDGEFYLGHDHGQYHVAVSWLKNMKDVLWCHAKNCSAFEKMLELGLHCFWHENDTYTLTSKSIPWCYPNNYVRNGITVIFGLTEPNLLPDHILGICTDYPQRWRWD